MSNWTEVLVMDRQDIETLVQRWTGAIATGQLEIFDHLLDKDVVDRSGSTVVSGVESFKARASMVRGAFADITIVVDDLIVEGNAIAWRWTLTGTHRWTFRRSSAHRSSDQPSWRQLSTAQGRQGRPALDPGRCLRCRAKPQVVNCVTSRPESESPERESYLGTPCQRLRRCRG